MITGIAAVTTLPPADDRLYGPDTFGPILLVAAIRGSSRSRAAWLAWALWPGRRIRIPAEPAGTLGLRQRYLRHIDELEQQVAAHELPPGALHHELSRTLRRFAVEARHGWRTSMSSGALDAAGQRAVAAAVRRFEHPQFEADPRGDPLVRARRRSLGGHRHGAADRRCRGASAVIVLAFRFRQAWVGVLVLALAALVVLEVGRRATPVPTGVVGRLGRRRQRRLRRRRRHRSLGSCAATSA